jgi:hypothetical protein
MLQASHASTEAYGIFVRLAPPCLNVDAARLHVINSSRNLVTPVAAWGDASQLPADEGFAPGDCWALRNGRPHVVADPAHEITCSHQQRATGDRGRWPSSCIRAASSAARRSRAAAELVYRRLDQEEAVYIIS